MKLLGLDKEVVAMEINYNMRCIETVSEVGGNTNPNLINYNMRCIETKVMNYFKLEVSRDKLQHEMY